MSAENEYRRPTAPFDAVKPGPGPTDFMELPLEPLEKFIEVVRDAIDSHYRKPRFGLQLIFRHLGSPRSWQLGGEQSLRALDEERLQWVVKTAKAELSSMKAGDKYIYCSEPRTLYEGPVPKRDYFDIELTERVFYLDTIPIEFLESLARLRD